MGIPGYTDVVRLPRLGIIRLGEKAVSQSGKEYPRALDHFNLKDAPAVAKVYGDAPKELDVMLPVEDVGKFFDQALRSYGKSSGLFCMSRDAQTATRVRLGVSDGKGKLPAGQAFDPQGEAYLKSTGEDVDVGDMYEIPCGFHDCPFYEKKHCKVTARLLILLPKVEGFGCWQVTTSSWHGMVAIQSYIAAIRGAVGRVSMIPLKLRLNPQEVQAEGKKKTVYTMSVVYEGTLPSLLNYANKLPRLPAPELPKMDPRDVPDDLYAHGGAALDAELGKELPAPKVNGDPAAVARARLGQPQPPPPPAPAPQPTLPDDGDAIEPVDVDIPPAPPQVIPPARTQAAPAAQPAAPAANGGARKARPWG